MAAASSFGKTQLDEQPPQIGERNTVVRPPTEQSFNDLFYFAHRLTDTALSVRPSTSGLKLYRRRGLNVNRWVSYIFLFDKHWQPKVIAEMNDYQFKLVKLQGDFLWHHHEGTDETFIVIEGELRIDFRDGCVRVSAGEMFLVPKGVEHKPHAEREVKLLLIEPRGVVNTGEETGARTAANDVWV